MNNVAIRTVTDFGKFLLKVIVVIVVIILILNIKPFLRERKLANNAISYFTNKYNINKKDIKIKKNILYGNEKHCLTVCGDNYLYITYKNKEYIIKYYPDKEVYTDNFQYEEINKELTNYLNTKFSYADEIKISFLDSFVMDSPTKYDGNIKKYIGSVCNELENPILRIDIWIKAIDSNTATELNNRYSRSIISELEEMKVKYKIAISEKSSDNEYFAFYHYHVTDVEYNYSDNVTKSSKQCQRSEYGICY